MSSRFASDASSSVSFFRMLNHSLARTSRLHCWGLWLSASFIFHLVTWCLLHQTNLSNHRPELSMSDHVNCLQRELKCYQNIFSANVQLAMIHFLYSALQKIIHMELFARCCCLLWWIPEVTFIRANVSTFMHALMIQMFTSNVLF